MRSGGGGIVDVYAYQVRALFLLVSLGPFSGLARVARCVLALRVPCIASSRTYLHEFHPFARSLRCAQGKQVVVKKLILRMTSREYALSFLICCCCPTAFRPPRWIVGPITIYVE